MNSFFIGVDVGGTYVRIVSYDESTNGIGDMHKALFKKFNDPSKEVHENLCVLMDSVIKEKSLENKELRGIGLSLAALFDRRSGAIVTWPNNRAWNGFPLRSYLMERYNVPVLFEDDANSAALGEHLAGAGKGYSDLAYVTISTGVGCGLILNNSLHIGSNGWAGEIGHIRVIEDGPDCKCGMNGCLQSLVSGPILLQKFVDLKMLERSTAVSELDLKDVVSLAANGDAVARDIFKQAGVHLGKMIGSMIMLLDISLIVLGGGVTGAGDILLEPLNDTLKGYLKYVQRDMKVIEARLGDNSGAIGALNLIYKQLNDGNSIEVFYPKGSESNR
ncbi:ROK family protein [Paenibacillus macquariensis]|uniref:Glucokinase n=1 Tax=Paenibacillus macquariensis TaxID=948756 RepID=A0ABY1K2N6_9BACL|nr:ROK family protein [Paenibacillus macquariensis]MEC0090212.1 ROK family protein [Paenibacillus macquariensis]OAB39583.1 sugar kinase [Paenibacillus macquariensis subsp. macquariensis]SIR17465.1 glucokinase [Paenibacillus macquariensis]